MDKMQAKFSDIDWDMAEFTCPPEAIFRDHFMKFGVWDAYIKTIDKKADISFSESVEAAKTLWRQFCDYQENHDTKEIKLKDPSIEFCEVAHTQDEPVISMMVSLPGLGGTEIVISRQELLLMLDALNGEW